jgi:hypothetical protein
MLPTLTFVGLGVVLTRFVNRCTLGMLASLLALTYSLAYRLLLCHLLLGLLGTSMQMHLP